MSVVPRWRNPAIDHISENFIHSVDTQQANITVRGLIHSTSEKMGILRLICTFQFVNQWTIEDVEGNGEKQC